MFRPRSEEPLYHILPLLVTDEFNERLHQEVRRFRYGTPEWVYFRREMLAAIEGVPKRRIRFNWTEGKKRAEEHLALYKEKLPSSKTVTEYEKWVLRYYDPKFLRLLQKASTSTTPTAASAPGPQRQS